MSAISTDQVKNEFGSPNFVVPSFQKTFSGRKYTFSFHDRDGPRFYDQSNNLTGFVADLSPYLPLLTPKLTKAGKVAKRQPGTEKKPLKWWKAQCGFRGLPVGGTVDALQGRLREHGNKGMSKAMAEFQDKLREEYLAKNMEEIEKRWNDGDNSEKAKIWPRRLLYESFFMKPVLPIKEVLVVMVDGWGNKITEVASALKIPCECTKLESFSTGQRLAVIGRDAQTVRAKLAELVRDDQRAGSRARQEQNNEFERRYTKAKSMKASGAKGLKEKWDVTGSWTISCPYVEQEWGQQVDSECGLTINFTKATSNGLVQMFAEFDFLVIEGIMRFVNPQVQDGEMEDQDDEGTTISSSTTAQFLLPDTSLPSSRSRNFKFRWRGEDTHEGVIQLTSDKKLCSMTFESPHALNGMFYSGILGWVEFKGVKTPAESGSTNAYAADPAYQWSLRSEEAYERARVGRWG
ncbi:uncharacterized protein Z519_00427 [Cladophialophora bantiana CBS 173.52]|uniref:Uncharacterized protein n=1 Tax=Cladophialophora bantiana (strain ATCC 10958 / CBS 173.52 / CDC B-1940 / NIH 8579) TaxID=1442370 RepID=A0A0D2IPN1_CLAB1|nr:uncharacterized protein Z519_00427 [Cladophialophora bantiana CBS 173.52]KIW98764.1 hypothetical protein Z519_00427 [Cladophialophora bantiana CBS 173.52]